MTQKLRIPFGTSKGVGSPPARCRKPFEVRTSLSGHGDEGVPAPLKLFRHAPRRSCRPGSAIERASALLQSEPSGSHHEDGEAGDGGFRRVRPQLEVAMA